MNRIEFLKRLGLGAVAAVAAPALIKSEPEIVEPLKESNQLAFWRQTDSLNPACASSAMEAVALTQDEAYDIYALNPKSQLSQFNSDDILWHKLK